ncbi:MAG: hypothetical protein JKY92_00440, partial [Magnetovibrio sp.]|nr:hypothetical protein [Magnetovibrio sp.]
MGSVYKPNLLAETAQMQLLKYIFVCVVFAFPAYGGELESLDQLQDGGLHKVVAVIDGDTVVFFVESDVVHMGDLCFNGMFPYIDT